MYVLNHSVAIFRKVAQLGSFSKAAQELYISQPAVSRAVKALEEELGIELFRRFPGNRVELTTDGRAVLSLVDQMALLENELYALSPSKSQGQSGILRVVAFPLACSSIIPAATNLLQRRYPRVVVDIVQGGDALAREMVACGEAQMGIVAQTSQEGLDSVLFTDEVVGVSAAGSDGRPMNLADGAEDLTMTHIAYDVVSSCATAEAAEVLARATKLHNAAAVVEKIKSDGGTGLIAREVLAGITNSLVIRPLVPRIFMYYGIVTEENAPRYVREFAQCCHEVIPEAQWR